MALVQLGFSRTEVLAMDEAEVLSYLSIQGASLRETVPPVASGGGQRVVSLRNKPPK